MENDKVSFSESFWTLFASNQVTGAFSPSIGSFWIANISMRLSNVKSLRQNELLDMDTEKRKTQ